MIEIPRDADVETAEPDESENEGATSAGWRAYELQTRMTREQAETKTCLSGREMTGDRGKDFLRCQLGRYTNEMRPNPRTGMPMPVSIFNLKGYGETWEAAVRKVRG